MKKIKGETEWEPIFALALLAMIGAIGFWAFAEGLNAIGITF